MFSVVLMVSLSGGAEVPDFGRHRRGRGGCSGAYSCGGGYGGCSGGYGCCGGGMYAGGYGYGCGGGGAGYYGGCSGGYDMAYGGGYGGYAVATTGRPARAPERIRNRPRSAGQATIVLSVPADARLTIDGRPTTSRSASRVFVTPPLQPNREYHYNVWAQVDRGGRTMTVTRRVAVRAGQVTQETLTFAPTQVARTP